MEPENGDALGVEDLREALELEGWMRKHHRPSMAQRLPGSSLQTKVYQSEGVSATGGVSRYVWKRSRNLKSSGKSTSVPKLFPRLSPL